MSAAAKCDRCRAVELKRERDSAHAQEYRYMALANAAAARANAMEADLCDLQGETERAAIYRKFAATYREHVTDYRRLHRKAVERMAKKAEWESAT